ncbi:MAG: hypothetical protein GY718_08195 [Lentisphaerae bacterium]|nr:hypothetical protein [Lentisphaerota bacterium]
MGNIEILNPKFLKEKDELRFLFMSSGKYDYNALKNNAFLKKLGAYLKINNAKTIGNVKFDNQFSFDEKLHISRNKKMTFQISYCSGEIPAEICTKSRVSKFRTGLLEKWQNTLLFKGKSIKFNIDQPVKLFRAKLWDKKGVLFADVKSSLIITRKKDAKRIVKSLTRSSNG